MIKVGIIGTGIVAREHAAAIAMAPVDVSLFAAADLDPQRLNDFADACKVERRYRSPADLISDHDVNLVTVATPPSSHEELVIAALKAGKCVLCEKPLAHSLASAERIAAAAEAFPGQLSVSYQFRYVPYVRRMLWLIENGWIGDIKSAVIERHSYIPHSAFGKGGWWGAWDIAGGGVLITQMIHELDIMLLAMGAAASVHGEMDTRFTRIQSEDWIEATVQFDGGKTARCAGSVNSGYMRGSIAIEGSLGTITSGKLSLRDPKREAKALAALDTALPDTRQPSMSLPSRALRKLRRKFGLTEKAELTPHAMLYCSIAQSISSNAPLPISAAQAMRSLQLCAGAYESAIVGRPVALPLNSNARTYAGVTVEDYASRKRSEQVKVPQPQVLPKFSFVRVGLIGLDTTHATIYTDLLHNPFNPDHIPGAKVVAAFPGGSPDMSISASRVRGFTSELRDKYGVPIVQTPEAVADAADVVLILSCDGRTHPGLFRSVAGRAKSVFIDKPLAISSADAQQIYAVAAETGTKLFASSSYRYADPLVAALRSIRESGERITACRVFYWGQIEPTQGRFYWYGIHGAEMLLAVMGKGVGEVRAMTIGDKDVIEIEHKDGRHSTIVGSHNDGAFHVSIDTVRRSLDIDISGPMEARTLAAALDNLTPGGYPRLWRVSDAGSVSGRPGKLVDPCQAETLEVIGLLDAAQRSYAAKQAVTL
jgi:predicted dehydrogenase